MKRLPLANGRARYCVRRPAWPLRLVTELAYVSGASVCGAGVITLLLVYMGLL